MSILAYLDPGTGSLIIQAIIAFFCGVAFTVKLYWRRFKAFFSGKSADKPEENQTPDGE